MSPGQRPAAVQRNPHAEGALRLQRVHLRERAPHRQGRLHRAIGVILLREWRAEHREDRVADELVERPFVLEQALRHPREVLVEELRNLIRLHPLAQRGERHDVAEHDRHVALLTRSAAIRRRIRRAGSG